MNLTLLRHRRARCVLVALALTVSACGSDDDNSSAMQQKIPLPGSPFAAITTLDGRYVFASLSGATNGVAVVRQGKTSAAVVDTIATCGPVFGLAVSNDGRYLLAVVQGGGSCLSGVQFINVPKAIAGDSGAAMGTVPTDPTAIDVGLSVDNTLVFVANENSATMDDEPDTVSVIDFNRALTSGQSASSVIGDIPVDRGPVGLAFSRNGHYLYVTNEMALPIRPYYDENACSIPDGGGGCPITTHKGSVGTLTVVNVDTARTDPANAAVAHVAAGCSPTRVILTNDDTVAWVSARDENTLLAFNATALVANVRELLSTTPVGTAPDGAQPFSHRRFIAVANTNRFDTCPGAGGTVSILDFFKALNGAGVAATVSTFDAGVFPRQWAVSPDGRLLYLTEFGSDTLAVFRASSIVNENASTLGSSRP